MTIQNPNAFGNRTKLAHKFVSRAVGYALTNRDETAMWLLSETIKRAVAWRESEVLAWMNSRESTEV